MPRAVSLTDEILHTYQHQLDDITLIPSTGGVYEITLDGELIFSKKELGRFPNEGEVLEILTKWID